ncbi:MAG: YdcF family protein [Treponema sp.]|nr:YdcF family protein [Treponema sp.]
MIFISKLFTALLLPPGCFFILTALLIIFIPRKYKIFPGLIAFIIYILSIQPAADMLLKPLENAYPALPARIDNDWPQAIVVLGGGTIQMSPEAAIGQDTLSSEAMKRAVYAFTLRDTFPVPFIFSGGKVFEYDQMPEAVTAGNLFRSLGMPEQRFIAEDKSRNTWENAAQTAMLGIERAVLVTSAYHMKRSVYCYEKNGISVIPAPTDYKLQRGRKYDFLSFLPSMGALQNTYCALHEYMGILFYIIAYH